MQEEHANGQQGSRQIGTRLVDFDALTISGPEGTLSLEPKVMAVLQVLVAEAPSVVTRDVLVERVWGGESGGDESLSRAISLLRKAFGDQRGQHGHIETIPRRGYRLVARVDVPFEGAEHGPGTTSPGGSTYRWPGLALIALLVIGLIVWTAMPAPESVPPAPDSAQAAPPPAPADRSIAVLPFSDLSPAGDQGYFADGLAEEILNALAGVRELKVAGRTSSFAYRDRDVDVRTVGTSLGVRHVLEGSVRKEGNELRITAQLVRTDDGFHSWSRSFDGSVDRVFDFQEEIAQDIARALEVTLSPDDVGRLAPALTSSQAAYDAFLQGRSIARRFGPEEKLRAAELLEQAVTLDPDFAHAWAELARTELFVPVSNPDRPLAPHLARAREAADRALTLDPELAIGHYVRGLIHESEADYAAAMDAIATAHRLEPQNPFIAIRYGYYLALLGQLELGVEMMSQGLRLDPTDAAGVANLGYIKLTLGDLNEAERLIRRAYDLGFKPAGGMLSAVLQKQGRVDESMAVWREYGAAVTGRYLPEFEAPEAWATFGDALQGRNADAREWAIDVFRDYFSQADSRTNTYRLYTLVQLGEPAEAMRLLLESPYPINAGFVASIWQDIHGFPALRQHPDFPDFARDIGLVNAWDSYGWPPQCERLPVLEAGGPAFRCR